tara:strand:- start:207 stop:743 length:537 start_codon:yes stop_codon:yes gene_type:complete
VGNLWTLHGALVTASGSATVERRTLAGEPATLILAVAGDLALPMLESVKDAFLGLTAVDEDTAAALLKTLSPPWVSGAAAAVSHGDRIVLATTGGGSSWRQRDGVLAPARGAHDLAWNEGWLVSADFAPEAGDFFGIPPRDAPTTGAPPFANDALDDVLRRALGDHAATVAATWVGEV